MADFSAKDIQRLRQSSGAGMMDAKKALIATDGDFDAAAKWLMEKGLAKSVERSDRDSSQGAVALGASGGARSMVSLRCETDFVAKSADFVNLVQDIADAVAAEGPAAAERFNAQVDEFRVSLKENITVGDVVHFEAADGHLLDSYLHIQNERGVNGVLVEVAAGTQELAHDLAVHIAFSRPGTMTRDEIPEAEIAEQREVFAMQTRNEGKPEGAIAKIVEGKLGGYFKRVPGGALLDQPFVKDDKQSVAKAIGAATIVRFAQVEIGG